MNKNLIIICLLFLVSCREEHLFYYNTGELMNKYYTVSGKKEGTAITYYKNGEVKVTQTFKNDLLHGEEEHYSENGYLTLKVLYKEGILLNRRAFLKNGELFTISTVDHSQMITRLENGFSIDYSHATDMSDSTFNYQFDSTIIFENDSSKKYLYRLLNFDNGHGILINFKTRDTLELAINKFGNLKRKYINE